MQWTAETIERAAALYRDGESYRTIAKRMGVSVGAISGMASRNRDIFPRQPVTKAKPKPVAEKTPGRRTVWTHEARQTAKAMWADGETVKAIAAAVGCARETAGRFIKSNPSDFPARKPSPESKPTYERQKPSARLCGIPVPAKDGGRQGTRRDLSDHALPGVAPKTLGTVGAGACRFPLAAFDAEDGPGVPCCGAAAMDGKSWCAAHYRIVFKRRAG